jgi:hypothetical protein
MIFPSADWTPICRHAPGAGWRLFTLVCILSRRPSKSPAPGALSRSRTT